MIFQNYVARSWCRRSWWVVGTEFNLAEHKQQVRPKEKHAKIMLRVAVADEESLVSIKEKHRLTRARKAGIAIWLTCFPNRLNGTAISAEDFRDNVRLCYNLKPLPRGMPENCDGCGYTLTVEHALACKCGGLVHIRHPT